MDFGAGIYWAGIPFATARYRSLGELITLAGASLGGGGLQGSFPGPAGGANVTTLFANTVNSISGDYTVYAEWNYAGGTAFGDFVLILTGNPGPLVLNGPAISHSFTPTPAGEAGLAAFGQGGAGSEPAGAGDNYLWGGSKYSVPFIAANANGNGDHIGSGYTVCNITPGPNTSGGQTHNNFFDTAATTDAGTITLKKLAFYQYDDWPSLKWQDAGPNPPPPPSPMPGISTILRPLPTPLPCIPCCKTAAPICPPNGSVF